MTRVRVLIRRKPDRDNLVLYYVDPLTGREVTRSAGTSDRREAERAAERWERELEEFGPIVTVTSWDEFREYFEDAHVASLSDRYAQSMCTALNQFEYAVGKPKTVGHIDSMAIARAVSIWRRSDLSPVTIANYVSHLRVALRWAHRQGLIRRLPEFPRVSRQGTNGRHMRGRPITTDEFGRMLRAVREVRPDDWPQWVRFMRGLWYSGLRLSEGITLSWDAPPIRIDLDTGQYPRMVFDAEGHKARRDELVPITPDFARWLMRTPPEDRTGLVLPLWSPRYKDHPIHDRAEIGRVIGAAGRKAGVMVGDGRYASAHDFRRSFGSRWASRVKPVVLKRLMRHASLETTLRYYVDHDADEVAAELWGAE